MIRLATALRLARAETRRAHGTLAFCVLAITLGVFAITAIRALTSSLRQGMDAEAQRLLGADVVLSGSAPLGDGVARQLADELIASGARSTASVRFYSMLARSEERAGAKATQLVRVRAIGDGFPFYGAIDSEPPGAFAQLGGEPSILLDPAVARALALQPGERVRLGQLELRVLGNFLKTAGSPGAEFSMAPYVFMHERHLAATGLLQTGSRIQHELLFALPPALSAEAWKDEHSAQAREAHLSIRTSREAASNVRRFMTRLSGFMTVVGLVTLFLGAVGIGSAMHAFMKSKLDHAAVLRCVGATSRDLFLVYSALAVGVALLGSVLGAVLGAAAPYALRGVSESLGAGFLPVDLAPRASPEAALHGIAAGTVATFAFTVGPIWRTAAVSPLRVLGRSTDTLAAPGRSSLVGVLGGGLALLTVFVLSLVETESLRTGVVFTVAISGALLALFGAARLFTRLARAVAPRLGSFHSRQGIASLHRPGNQTSAVIVAVGMGYLLLGTLMILQHSIEELLALEQRGDLPNFFVIDIQPDQESSVSELVAAAGASATELSPMVSARIASVNGRSVTRADGERDGVPRDEAQRSWEDRMRTREYFVSYRAEPVAAETVVLGQFWSGRPARQEASLDEGLARGLGIELGDTLTLDVQGVPIDATVTSFREIRWQALRPNAMILLSPGEIELAPKMLVASARVERADARAELSQRLVERHANLTVIDATEAAQTVLSILDRVSAVLRGLGLLALFAGAIILAGAIAAGRFARQREAALLKVLGASRRDLRRILATEYVLLAVFGVGAGWALAELVGRAAIPFLFDTPARVPYVGLALLGMFTLGLNIVVAVLAGRRVSRHTALAILREE